MGEEVVLLDYDTMTSQQMRWMYELLVHVIHSPWGHQHQVRDCSVDIHVAVEMVQDFVRELVGVVPWEYVLLQHWVLAGRLQQQQVVSGG